VDFEEQAGRQGQELIHDFINAEKNRRSALPVFSHQWPCDLAGL
jgi:hypothetical protein